MPLTALLLAALVSGFLAGIGLRDADPGALGALADVAVLVGELWLRALQMTSIPLLIALLVTGVAGARDVAAGGRIAARTLVVVAVFVVGAALLGLVVALATLAAWPVEDVARAALIAGIAGTDHAVPGTPPPLRSWLLDVIPANPFAALSQGSVLSVVLFVLLFAFALARLPEERRAPVLQVFRGALDAMLVLVGWVLKLAPVGAFGLALGVGLRGGADAAGAVLHYVALEALVGTAILMSLYPVAVLAGRVPLLRFARAAIPVQVVASSTQSSLATLPAMLTAAQGPLALSPQVAGVTLPIAVSLFKVTSAAMNLAVVLFCAHVLAIPLGPATLLAGFVVACLVSFGIAGLPGAASFFASIVPIALTMGVPTGLLALLVAVEVLPDIFRTVGNVTADLAVATVVARSGTDAPHGEGG